MSYKTGLILSLVFVIMFFVFAVDLISLQSIYTDLDSKAVAIGYLISQKGSIEQSFIDSLEEEFNVTFTCEENCTPRFKDVVKYKLAIEYNPLIISKEQMIIEIHRSTVIGYYM